MASPEAFPRRSFVWRQLVAAGARFVAQDGAAVAQGFAAGDEREAAQALGLADLSPLPRLGFKGRSALAYVRRRRVRLEPAPNRAFRQADGGLAAVLAPGEVLLLAPLAGAAERIAKLAAGWSIEQAEGCYLVPRGDSHAWFMVTGGQAPALFAKLCGVDLRPGAFAELAIAQTSVARLNAIVIRADLGATLAYHLLADSAAAAWLWDCLTDAMAEFRGRPVGRDALQALAG